MTALADVIRRHEAAVAAGSLPSTTYIAGGVLTAERWSAHARHMLRTSATRMANRCAAMAKLARAYPIAVEVIDKRGRP